MVLQGATFKNSNIRIGLGRFGEYISYRKVKRQLLRNTQNISHLIEQIFSFQFQSLLLKIL